MYDRLFVQFMLLLICHALRWIIVTFVVIHFMYSYSIGNFRFSGLSFAYLLQFVGANWIDYDNYYTYYVVNYYIIVDELLFH